MKGTFLKIILMVAYSIKYSFCSVDGISYMDPLNFKPLPDPPGSDPCNPLYWYPKTIPEYCYMKNTPKPKQKDPGPLPMPIPVPMPQPVPVPFPPLPPLMTPMAPLPAPCPPAPLPPMPLPYGVPLAPSDPMLPVAGYPQMPLYSSYPQSYLNPNPFPRQPIGMVPGIPGLVSQDGGINILPFSDVYSDMLEKHKNKLLRKKLLKVIGDYDDFPRMRFRRRRKHRRRSDY